MADPVYDLDGFSVGGRTQGTITLPCDGTTQINIAVQMRARLDPGKAAVIPVWIGESGVFSSSNLIEDVFTLVNGFNRRIWVYKSKTYTLQCTTGCKLSPGGPATAKYTANGSEMDITCAFFNPHGTGYPFIGWWYSMTTVTVRCSSEASGITYAMLDDRALGERLASVELAQFTDAVEAGRELAVNDAGQIIVTGQVTDSGCDGETT